MCVRVFALTVNYLCVDKKCCWYGIITMNIVRGSVELWGGYGSDNNLVRNSGHPITKHTYKAHTHKTHSLTHTTVFPVNVQKFVK